MLRPEFTVRRTGERYDQSEVDALVARVVATAERIGPPTVTAAELRNVAFGTPVFGAGYSAEEVDRFIAEAQRWMPQGSPQDVVRVQDVQHHREPQQAPSFSRVRFQEGYDSEEVDAFVGRILATVNGQPVDVPVTAQDIENVQFTPVRFRDGYDVNEVDIFLETAETWLRQP